ncbi:MAG: response regulator [Syntrophobacteraceae bacterium]|nr:response regulator [Desulfobacteraceae bacterium]
MKVRSKPIVILMADDDQDDCMLVKDVFEELHLAGDLYFVDDGDKLLDFLHHRGAYTEGNSYPRPSLILLDLNMPRKDGREALREIKADRSLRSIPVVILTTSNEEEDICRSYKAGANSFITKPVTFEGLADVMKSLGKYWFEIVELPSEAREA